jgi:hypothetical protein
MSFADGNAQPSLFPRAHKGSHQDHTIVVNVCKAHLEYVQKELELVLTLSWWLWE